MLLNMLLCWVYKFKNATNLATRHRQKHTETGRNHGLDYKVTMTWKMYFPKRPIPPPQFDGLNNNIL